MDYNDFGYGKPYFLTSVNPKGSIEVLKYTIFYIKPNEDLFRARWRPTNKLPVYKVRRVLDTEFK